MWRVLAAMVWVLPWQVALLTSPPQLPLHNNQSSLEGNIVLDHIALTQMLDQLKNLVEGASETRSHVRELTTWFSTHREHQDEVAQELREVSAGVKNLTQQLRPHLQKAHLPDLLTANAKTESLLEEVTHRENKIIDLETENNSSRAEILRLEEEITRIQSEKHEIKGKVTLAGEVVGVMKRDVREVEAETLQVTLKIQEVERNNERARNEIIQLRQETRLLKEINRNLEDEKRMIEQRNREIEEEKNQLEERGSHLKDEYNQTEHRMMEAEEDKAELEQRKRQLEEKNRQMEDKNNQDETNQANLERRVRELETEKRSLTEKKEMNERSKEDSESVSEQLGRETAGLAAAVDALTTTLHQLAAMSEGC